MAPSATQRLIPVVSKAVLTGGMRSAGFRRQGNHLHRHVDGLIHGIQFQASRWGTITDSQFTVNLIVTSPAIYTCWIRKPMPRNPASVSFPVRQRIGSLLPDPRDKWWPVGPLTDVKALCAEVTEAVVTFSPPFFAMYASADAFL